MTDLDPLPGLVPCAGDKCGHLSHQSGCLGDEVDAREEALRRELAAALKERDELARLAVNVADVASGDLRCWCPGLACFRFVSPDPDCVALNAAINAALSRALETKGRGA